jgi:hypothetical protein
VTKGKASPHRSVPLRGAWAFMEKEYDFSKGVRGKFYRPNVRLNLPIYLDDDIADFVQSRLASCEEICQQWSDTEPISSSG